MLITGFRVSFDFAPDMVQPANLREGDFSPTIPDSSPSGIYFGLGKQMRRAHFLILLAGLLHAASWFLPAVKGFLGSKLDHGIPGWSVFLAATCALRPCEGTSVDPWYGTAISVIGVVTTVLFVLVSPWIVWRASRNLRRAAALVATAAFVVNSQWYVFYVPDRSDLGVGYFLWCGSFGLLAIGLFLLAGSNDELESTQRQSPLVLTN